MHASHYGRVIAVRPKINEHLLKILTLISYVTVLRERLLNISDMQIFGNTTHPYSYFKGFRLGFLKLIFVKNNQYNVIIRMSLLAFFKISRIF